MHRSAKLAGALALTLGSAGCGDFLTGPGLTENPNQPVEASATQLFVGAQASQFVQFEGQLARTASMWVQQVSGTNNQQQNYGSQYLFGETETTGWFASVYSGGGLVDLRKVQEAAKEAGDQKYEGIAKVWEAFVIGMAASMWGDIPYREAVNPDVTRPKLDPQQQVYSDVQVLLDDAIKLLDGAGAGPGAADLAYGGDTGRWKRLAYTLKARFHLHTAERLGPAAYTAALAAAQNGINEAPANVAEAVHSQAAGDFRSRHDNELEKANIWAQFIRARSDMVAGKYMVDLLNSRTGDPRLAGYFDPVAGGVYRGADQWGRTFSQPMSEVDTETRRQFTFRQPFVTWSENELIKAEALFQLGRAAEALTAVNNVRTRVGLAPLAGPVTLAQIMEEKYIALFQNIEAWNDYKRTCFPKLTPAGQIAGTSAAAIPGRYPYGRAERENNPNIPVPGQAPVRNWNDPNACT